MKTNAKVVLVLDRFCSCCLDDGRLEHLLLVRAGLFSFAFCVICDGETES